MSIDMQNRKQNRNTTELCLCGKCLSDFRLVKRNIVKRSNKTQHEKDICSFCNYRKGFDYIIEERQICKLGNRIIEGMKRSDS